MDDQSRKILKKKIIFSKKKAIRKMYAVIYDWINNVGVDMIKQKKSNNEAQSESNPYVIATIRASELPIASVASIDEMNLLFCSLVMGRLQWIAGSNIKDENGESLFLLAQKALKMQETFAAFIYPDLRDKPLYEEYKSMFE